MQLVNVLAGYWVMPEIATNIIIFFNIVGAMLLGLLVGYERSYRGRAAGMRTYAFVCMASCALTVITGYPAYWFGSHAMADNVDPGRVIQGIVTGIGFLGAGVIMRDGMNISGLMTAASIWTVAVVGVLVGVGFYGAAISLSALSAFFMIWGARIESLLPSRHAIALTLDFKKGVHPIEAQLDNIIGELGYEIAKGSYAISKRDGRSEWRFVAVSLGRGKSGTLVAVNNQLARYDFIDSYQVVHARN